MPFLTGLLLSLLTHSFFISQVFLDFKILIIYNFFIKVGGTFDHEYKSKITTE